MITFLIIAAYIGIAGFTAAVFYEVVFADENYHDGMEWPLAGFIGLLWPLALVIAIPAWLGMYISRKIVAYNKKREAI